MLFCIPSPRRPTSWAWSGSVARPATLQVRGSLTAPLNRMSPAVAAPAPPLPPQATGTRPTSAIRTQDAVFALMVHPPPGVGNAKRYIGRLNPGLAGLPDSAARNWQKTHNTASIGLQEGIN